MSQKISNLILVTIIALILLATPAWWLSPWVQWNTKSLEGRLLTRFPVFNLKDTKQNIKLLLRGEIKQSFDAIYTPFLKRSIQKQMETASNDQFPQRIPITKIGKRAELAQIWTAYLPFNDPAVPISSKLRVMKKRDENLIFYFPDTYNASTRQMIDQHIQNYADLIRAFPNLRFYAYYIEQIHNSEYHPMASYFPQADAGLSIAYFEQHKPAQLTLGKLPINSFQDQRDHFFHTDHHWSIQGAWLGYEGIYQMLAKNYPEIGPMLKPIKFATVPGLDFCGSLARITIYPCQPETFDYVQVDLPPYQTIVNGKKEDYGQRNAYLDGEFATEEYANHYGYFYGADKGLVEYDFQNASKRNLLLIGSSFTQSMEVYIASHYHNTYTIDLRHYKDFKFGEFIAQHPVDDVLILNNAALYNSSAWFINP